MFLLILLGSVDGSAVVGDDGGSVYSPGGGSERAWMTVDTRVSLFSVSVGLVLVLVFICLYLLSSIPLFCPMPLSSPSSERTSIGVW